MIPSNAVLSHRERELAAIITAYSEVTEQLRRAHEQLNHEVRKLHHEIESKNLELARRERLAALGEMAAGLAHEIRNPLGGIQLFASLLERDLKALPESQRLVRKISAGVDSLERIVSDILDFAGQRPPQPRRVTLAEVVGAAVELAAPRREHKSITIDVHAEVQGLQAVVDPAQMERVLLNLLLNAVDVTPPGGTVGIRAQYDPEGDVLLHVHDQGPGVPQDVRERIFNPFFTTKDHGTGLGLAIVHRIMEGHGGDVRVSDDPCGGACFTLRIPGALQAVLGAAQGGD